MDNKLLLVEDDEILREILTENLADVGFEVITASDGLEALCYLKLNPPVSIIISDIQMPQMDGLELLRQIKNQNLTTEIVFIMTAGALWAKKDAFELGATHFFDKLQGLSEIVEAAKSIKKWGCVGKIS